MKQSFIICTTLLFLFATTIFSSTNQLNIVSANSLRISEALPVQKNAESITVVYPNPTSGILNLQCGKDFSSPITLKAINKQEKLLITLNALKAEGVKEHKFVQINTSELNKGEYKIELFDANGKTITRRIYIEK